MLERAVYEHILAFFFCWCELAELKEEIGEWEYMVMDFMSSQRRVIFNYNLIAQTPVIMPFLQFYEVFGN